MPITVRGSSVSYITNASSSGTVAVPAGSQVGDICYVFGGHGFAFSSISSGGSGTWAQMDRLDGSGYNGACYAKVLDAADIAGGTFAVGFSGAYFGSVAAVTFVGAAATLRTFASQRNSGSAASRTSTTDASPQSGDYALYFGAGRFNGAVTTTSGGALQSQSAVESSSVLTGGLLGAGGAVSATFNYAAATSGDYDIVLIVKPVAPTSTGMGFDPAPGRKQNQTLSNFSAKATSTGVGGVAMQRVIQGKTYIEFVPTVITGTPSVGVASGGWTGNVALTGRVDLLGYLASGAVQVNGVTLQTIAAWAATNRIGMAINPFNRLIWFRVNGGNWNNSGTADPATDTGGIDYSSAMTGLGTLVPAVYATLTGTVWDVTSEAASFVDVPPSGYSDLSAVQYTRAQTTNPNNAPAGPVVALQTPGGVTAPVLPTGSNGKEFMPAGPVTVVSGTTKEAGVIVTGKVVEVYDRDTGDLLGRTKSDAMGNWSIPALGRPAVRVVGSDPTTYNSLVYDNVVPV